MKKGMYHEYSHHKTLSLERRWHCDDGSCHDRMAESVLSANKPRAYELFDVQHGGMPALLSGMLPSFPSGQHESGVFGL